MFLPFLLLFCIFVPTCEENQSDFTAKEKISQTKVYLGPSTRNDLTTNRPEKSVTSIFKIQTSTIRALDFDFKGTVYSAMPRNIASSIQNEANIRTTSVVQSSNPWASNKFVSQTYISTPLSYGSNKFTVSYGSSKNLQESIFGSGSESSSVKTKPTQNQDRSTAIRREEVTETMSQRVTVSEASSNTSITEKLKCSKLRSCENKCQRHRDLGVTNPWTRCFCDPFCETFQDCCADFESYCAHLNLSVMEEKTDLWGCIPLSRSLPGKADYFGIWMISACPRGWNRPVVRAKCQIPPNVSTADYRETVPVVSSSGTTFKNRYCAECNGVHKLQLTDYMLHGSCFAGHSQSKKCASQTGSVSCRPLDWIPPYKTHRRYCLKLQQCSPGNVGFQECVDGKVGIVRGYHMGKRHLARTYKNHFCATCDGAALPECGPFMNVEDKELGKAYSAMFNPPHEDGSGTNSGHCPSGEIYDAVVKLCRRAVELQATRPSLKRYQVLWWITLPNNSLATCYIPNAEHIKASLYSLFRIQPFHIAEVSFLVVEKDQCVLTFDIDWPFDREPSKIRSGHEPFPNFTEPSSVKLGDELYYVSRISTRLLECARYEEFTSVEYTFIPSYNPVVFLNGSREIFYEHQYHAEKLVRENCLPRPNGTISVCRLYLTAGCSGNHVLLQRHEYTIFVNGTLYRNDSRKTYEIGMYVTRNNTAWICKKYEKKGNPGAPSSDLLVILTLVGLSLSVFGLVVTLLTFSLFAELRTLFGISLMNLCTLLLFQQSLYFLTGQTENPTGCGIIAALIHYFILASFSWMSTIAFTARRTICSDKVPLKGTAAIRLIRRRLPLYMAFGWLLPLPVLGISLALDLSGRFRVGYGGPDGCLITNNLANIVFLYAPIGLSIVFNAVMFVATSIFLRRREKATTAVLHKARKRALPAVTRLAVLMGFTWIFGFLGLLVSEVFFYPFTVLSTLHGVYIVVAFVCRRKILKRYRKLIFPENQTKHEVEKPKPKVQNIAAVANETCDTRL